MNGNKTISRENDDHQRFYRAMAILRQKIETLLENTPNLLAINSLQDIVADKREVVENQLWNIFVYGEYYVEKIISDLSGESIIAATGAGKAHFEYHRTKYKSFIKKLEGLIDVPKAPKRKEVEIALINAVVPGLFDASFSPPEITECDIDDFLDSCMDDYEELALYGYECLQKFVRTHLANPVEEYAPASFEAMLLVLRNYQANIRDRGGPSIITWGRSLMCDEEYDEERDRERKEEDANERQALDLQLSDCETMIAKPYFRPDDWVANENELSPIIVDREREKIPLRIQTRIHEIHSSFIFGNWMSVIALSRCLLEYAIIDRKTLLNLDIYYNEDEKRRKSLEQLILDAAEVFPELEEGMERIREGGNRVMHPSPQGTLSKFPPGKADAKDCMDAITKIISTLYSSNN